jgi:Fe-S-cluster containining protein
MGEKVQIEFELQMGSEGVRVTLAVPTAPVAARRVLPIFQGVTNQVVDVAVTTVTKRGETVSCKAGCGACCRTLVPVSFTEARQLRALVDAMPEPRRTEVRARFADAVARLEAAGMLEEMRDFDARPDAEYLTLHPRYFALGLPCPFLEDESCSIYAHRPLVCREYLVTSPAELCSDPTSRLVTRVPLPAFPSLAVCNLEGPDPKHARLALALALVWTDEHAGEAETLRPASEWIDVVLGGITAQQQKPAPA